jgi:primary-amine oxidase
VWWYKGCDTLSNTRHITVKVQIMSHPLAILSIEETNLARDVVKSLHPGVVIDFREIFLQEPPKAQLVDFLAIEHAGRLSPTTPRPARLALCQYDVIGPDRIPQFHESVIDVVSQSRVKHTVVGKEHHASLTLYGLIALACQSIIRTKC